jgi:peptidoglycan/xylan/chitin deacetylase (PgdA/CDA1 family)
MSRIENPIPWPGGARCAASFSFDVDIDSMLRLTYGPKTPEKLQTLSWLGYEEVGVPRLVRLYEELGIKQTFFFPGYCIDTYPDMVRGVLDGGHEIGLHGYMHEVMNEQDAKAELEILERGLEATAKLMDSQPVGWRAPLYAIADRTPELLLDHGFVYDASLMGDDQPYLLRTPKGDLVELPSETANDDWTHYAHVPDLDYMMQIRAPAVAEEVYRAEFEAAYANGGLWVSVWHPSISARLSRIEVVERMARDMLERGDVWVASLGEIAAHVKKLVEAGEWEPRTVEVERADASAGKD